MRLSSVDLPEPDGPISAVNSPGCEREVDAVQHLDLDLGAGTVGLVDVRQLDQRPVARSSHPDRLRGVERAARRAGAAAASSRRTRSPTAPTRRRARGRASARKDGEPSALRAKRRKRNDHRRGQRAAQQRSRRARRSRPAAGTRAGLRRALAPIARRMPISRRFCTTQTTSTLAMPSATMKDDEDPDRARGDVLRVDRGQQLLVGLHPRVRGEPGLRARADCAISSASNRSCTLRSSCDRAARQLEQRLRGAQADEDRAPVHVADAHVDEPGHRVGVVDLAGRRSR